MSDHFESYEIYISTIRDVLKQDPVRDLCIKFVEFLHQHPPDQYAMLSYIQIADLLGKKSVDDDVQRIITFLVSSNFYILDVRYLYIEGDKETQIENKDFENTIKTGVFIHPHTGEEVKAWQKSVFPYFVPSPRLFSLFKR